LSAFGFGVRKAAHAGPSEKSEHPAYREVNGGAFALIPC